VDREAACLTDFVCGANVEHKHFTGANWVRDCPLDDAQIVDARTVVEGDPAPGGQGELRFLKGIEVGHIFQLGTVYSAAMDANVLDKDGRTVTPIMGCYGMGVTRLVAAVIEQNHDGSGITWPIPLAPFQLHLIALNIHKSEAVQTAAENIYLECQQRGIDVLFDDRDERPGVKFAEADLIGIPHRVVVGDRGLKTDSVEYKQRTQVDSVEMPLNSVLDVMSE
jgi:prolyl-tRNA synthetase